MANGKESDQSEPGQSADVPQGERDSPLRVSKPWMRFAGMGVELASYTLAMTAVGYAIDQYRDHDTPIATAFGTMIGFSFGMFRFIQRASKASSI